MEQRRMTAKINDKARGNNGNGEEEEKIYIINDH